MPALEKTLTEQFVGVAAERTEPTTAIRRAAARSLFDFSGCVRSDWGPPAWPIDRASALAFAAHRIDQDDLHLGSVTHPGGVVWSAVAACAGEATLAEAMSAAAFGYELVVRLGEALGAEHRRLWHSTATAGTAGAAGAAALLLGADPAIAVAHALSVAGGSAQALVERSGTRFLHRAHTATAGVSCARAAASGLGASRLGLEGGRGAFASAAADPDFSAVLLTARGSSAIEETGFRLHATTGFAHAAVDAAAALGPLDPDAVAAVRATVSPAAAVVVASAPEPAGDEEAWWSIEHAVAVSLDAGDPGALGARSDRDDVLALCRRVKLVPGNTGWAAEVEVELRDGTVRSSAVEGPRGHGTLAASDDELCRKWRRLTGIEGEDLLAGLLARDGSGSFQDAVADLLPG